MEDNKIRNCAQLCLSIYRGVKGKVRPLPNSIQTNFYQMKRRILSFECMREETTDEIYWFFQGTNGHIDGLNNTRFLMKKEIKSADSVKASKVHRGFYNYFNIFHKSPYFYSMLSDISSSGKRVILSGHSLGASVALLAAYFVPHCFDFDLLLLACPPTGNSNFADEINTRFPELKRYIYGNDIIELGILKGFGYKHCGQKIQLGKKKLFPNNKDHRPEFYFAWM